MRRVRWLRWTSALLVAGTFALASPAAAQSAGLDLHVVKNYGESPHHVVEAIFKGLARALRAALEIDPRQHGLPTVKGAL